MSTAPFHPDVAELVKGTHEARVTARAISGGTVLELDLEDYTVDWTERRTPRVSASLVCPVPTEEELALLDPRTYVRIIVTVEYRLPSGTWDTHDVAHLTLRARRVDRPRNTLTLDATSHEALLLDYAPVPQHPQDYGTGDMDQVWSSGSGMAKSYVEDMLYELRQGPLADLEVVDEVRTGPVTVVLNASDTWDKLMSAAEQQGFDITDAGDLAVRLAPLPVLAPETTHVLTVGANGTVLESSAGVDRDDWANYVCIRFKWWSDLDDRDLWVYGTAKVTAGPYAPVNAGWKLLVEDREGHPNQQHANAAAARILERLLSRSRSLTIRAVAAWWLRDGDTVTVQLPTGAQERHLVAGVVFNGDSTMTVVTRLPDAVSTIGA